MKDTLIIEKVSKRFGNMQAVSNVSLHVRSGEIFGLLGPNGAGKTTTIRMALDILRPDSGTISILGGPMTEEKKNHIGYLPEERGLYADVKLWQVILYLASLKGIDKTTATTKAEQYLKQLDLWEHRYKKLKEMSRGMHQKAQFIVTILHDPELIIVDEPFSGLDPVNTELVKKMLLDLKAQDKTIIMCTHQMHQVEAMCDRIGLIHKGNMVLEGGVNEIRQRYAGNTVEVRGQGPITELAGIVHYEQRNGLLHLTIDASTSPQDLLQTMVMHPDISVEHFVLSLPSLNDIFIQIVGGNNG